MKRLIMHTQRVGDMWMSDGPGQRWCCDWSKGRTLMEEKVCDSSTDTDTTVLIKMRWWIMVQYRVEVSVTAMITIVHSHILTLCPNSLLPYSNWKTILEINSLSEFVVFIKQDTWKTLPGWSTTSLEILKCSESLLSHEATWDEL